MYLQLEMRSFNSNTLTVMSSAWTVSGVAGRDITLFQLWDSMETSNKLAVHALFPINYFQAKFQQALLHGDKILNVEQLTRDWETEKEFFKHYGQLPV